LYSTCHVELLSPVVSFFSVLQEAIQQKSEESLTKILATGHNFNEYLVASLKNPPLHACLKDGCWEVGAKMILEKRKGKLDLSLRDDQGATALHLASESNQVEAVEMLMSLGAPLDATDNEVVRFLSAYWFLLLCSSLFFSSKTPGALFFFQKATPLHRAALQGYVTIVKMLLDKGGNLNCVDEAVSCSHSVRLVIAYVIPLLFEILLSGRNSSPQSLHSSHELRSR
jgi:hypothetical protein